MINICVKETNLKSVTVSSKDEFEVIETAFRQRSDQIIYTKFHLICSPCSILSPAATVPRERFSAWSNPDREIPRFPRRLNLCRDAWKKWQTFLFYHFISVKSSHKLWQVKAALHTQHEIFMNEFPNVAWVKSPLINRDKCPSDWRLWKRFQSKLTRFVELFLWRGCKNVT